MELKSYQQKALEQLGDWYKAMTDAARVTGQIKDLGKASETVYSLVKNFPLLAWETLGNQGKLPTKESQVPEYIPRTAACREPIPHICLKVPTGGGKTLLGVAALERIRQERGLVLWVVPTKAIYRQTIKAFRTREHPYRQRLEQIAGGRLKLLEKNDQFTRQDIESRLCVMMLMFPSTNRRKGKEFLKIFRDSGRYASFFPEQDDATATDKFIEQFPDLERNKSDSHVKHSLINVLKIIRPTVILDEAHKMYGKQAQDSQEFVDSINRLNPGLVVELSATPQVGVSNILVNIGGRELQDEEMVKLPIEIHNFNSSDWKRTLAESQKKLNELEREAKELRQRENRYIRPIALVRVQRTGKEQRGQGFIHAEDAREYLTQNLAVPPEQVRVQSSTQKELAGEDLLSEMSSVRWIITKDALKEGWDCSFAYVLAMLDGARAQTAITQMVGRVMRQPQANSVKDSDALNRCYVYCYNKETSEAVEWVKTGLENEGLTGLGDSVIGNLNGKPRTLKQFKRRDTYKRLKIFLPWVLHKEKSKWKPIDYDRDILGCLDWEKINTGAGDVKDLEENRPEETTAFVDIAGTSIKKRTRKVPEGENLTVDYFTRRLVDVVPNPWQAARIASGFLKKYREQYDDNRILEHRVYLSEILKERIVTEVDSKAERVFRDKIKNDEIRFHLATDENLNYEFRKAFEVSVTEGERSLERYGNHVQRSLFETVFESEFNNFERDVAFYLDESNSIYWWHKVAARQQYFIQGWRRHRVYPDFVVCKNGDNGYLVLETKGTHLAGNDDTEYKKELLKTLEAAYRNALDRGIMEVSGGASGQPDMTLRMLFENNWKGNLDETLKAGVQGKSKKADSD